MVVRACSTILKLLFLSANRDTTYDSFEEPSRMEHEARLRDEEAKLSIVIKLNGTGLTLGLLISSLVTITLVSSTTTSNNHPTNNNITRPETANSTTSVSYSVLTLDTQPVFVINDGDNIQRQHAPPVSSHRLLPNPIISQFKSEDALTVRSMVMAPVVANNNNPLDKPSSSLATTSNHQQLHKPPQFQLLSPIQQNSARPKTITEINRDSIQVAQQMNLNGRILNNYSTVDYHHRLYQPPLSSQRNSFSNPYTTQQILSLSQPQTNYLAPVIGPQTSLIKNIHQVDQSDAQARSHDGPMVITSAPVNEIQPVNQKSTRSSLANILKTTNQSHETFPLSHQNLDAKNLLTSAFTSIERRTTAGSLFFGSGLLAAVVPLIALVLPEGGSISSPGESAASNSGPRRNIVGLLGQLVSQSSNNANLQGRVESVMGWVERSIEHLPNFPRLHPQECVKRSICEAHNEPKKYGAIGFVLRIMFPASNLSSTDTMDNMEYKVINKYRHAASFGSTKRLDVENGTLATMPASASGAACKDKYEDCLVSLLEVAQNLVDIFVK